MEQPQSIVFMPAGSSLLRNMDVLDSAAANQEGQAPECRSLVLEGKGVWHRAFSYTIDAMTLYLLSGIAGAGARIHLAIVEALLGRPLSVGFAADVSMLMLGVAMNVVYFSLFEGMFGATPGKAITRLRVVRVDGSPCSLTAAVVRTFIRFVDSWFLCLVAVANMRKPLNQRWGDKLARTQVVGSRDPGIRQHRSWLRFMLALVIVWVLQTTFVATGLLLLP